MTGRVLNVALSDCSRTAVLLAFSVATGNTAYGGRSNTRTLMQSFCKPPLTVAALWLGATHPTHAPHRMPPIHPPGSGWCTNTKVGAPSASWRCSHRSCSAPRLDQRVSQRGCTGSQEGPSMAEGARQGIRKVADERGSVRSRRFKVLCHAGHIRSCTVH